MLRRLSTGTLPLSSRRSQIIQDASLASKAGVAYGPSTNAQSARRTVTLYEVAPAGIGTQKTARLPAGTPAMTSRSLVLTTWPALPSPCTLIATLRAGTCPTLRTSPQTARHPSLMALSLHDGRRLPSETALTVWAAEALLSASINPVASSFESPSCSLLSGIEGL